MASCDTTVLTGQEGLIQFKPLGTTNCIADYCPWGGTDNGSSPTPTRIYLPCGADYDIDDCIEVDAISIPATEGVQWTPTGQSKKFLTDGDTFYVIDTGVGLAGDVDNCGNDMEGVPYIVVAEEMGGATGVSWDVTAAGEEISFGMLFGSFTPAVAGTGYNGGVAGVLTGVELIDITGSGRGGIVNLMIGTGGAVTSVEIVSMGSGYTAGSTLMFEAENGDGIDAQATLGTFNVRAARGNSAVGHYILRLCEFQTVCGVRSFSIDLSRDELDVTTLPCSVSQACGKELASFRKTQAGFASATGTLEVYFSCDQTSTANKLLTGSLQKVQGGASVRLYVCTKTNADGSIDEGNSLYIEADIQLLGMSFSVDPDNPTTATINFGVTSVTSAFGLQGET